MYIISVRNFYYAKLVIISGIIAILNDKLLGMY